MKVKETETRAARYRRVLDLLAANDTFRLAEIKQTLVHETPAFVTRTIRRLTEQGWLLPSNDDMDRYQWNRVRGPFQPDEWIREAVAGNQVTAQPPSERPRERLIAEGAAALKDSELLAILIRSGRQGESAVQAGAKIARAFDGRLETLPQAQPAELKEISKVVANTAYCQIMAGIELGRRIAEIAGRDKTPDAIGGAEDAIRFCERQFHRLIHDSTREEFHIVTLDTKHHVIDTHQVSVGTLDASLVHPREVFRPAIKDAASAILLVHNHPSGDPTPSPEDRKVTTRLESAGRIIGIDVLDHIVLGAFRSVSIRMLDPGV